MLETGYRLCILGSGRGRLCAGDGLQTPRKRPKRRMAPGGKCDPCHRLGAEGDGARTQGLRITCPLLAPRIRQAPALPSRLREDIGGSGSIPCKLDQAAKARAHSGQLTPPLSLRVQVETPTRCSGARRNCFHDEKLRGAPGETRTPGRRTRNPIFSRNGGHRCAARVKKDQHNSFRTKQLRDRKQRNMILVDFG